MFYSLKRTQQSPCPLQSKEDILTYHAADFHPDAINLLNVKYTDKSVCDSVIWRHLKGECDDLYAKNKQIEKVLLGFFCKWKGFSGALG